MRVLIIDDSVDASYLLSKLVEHCGHETRVVNLPEQAAEVAAAWQPDFIFTDVVMPGMDGYTVARQLRNDAGLSNAPIYALSGGYRSVGEEEVAGIHGHLLKPIGLRQIDSLLRAHESTKNQAGESISDFRMQLVPG